MSQIQDAIKAIEQMQANNEGLAEASRRLGQIESDVRRLRQSHTDLLAALGNVAQECDWLAARFQMMGQHGSATTLREIADKARAAIDKEKGK